VNSYSDFWINEADEWRGEVFELFRCRDDLIFQIPTKRPHRILNNLPADWGEGYPNVWLGVTIENKNNFGRWAELVEVPAAAWFISYEPAVGPFPWDEFSHVEVKLKPSGRMIPLPDWFISGGESGPDSRPADPQWFRDCQAWCHNFEIPYFHKQNGGNVRVDGTWGGDTTDGIRYKEFPELGTVTAT